MDGNVIMTQELTDAFKRACTSFQDAAVSKRPIKAFIDGMRAMCDGAELGTLSTMDRCSLGMLLTVAKPNVLCFATDIAADPNRLEDLRQVIEPFMQTLTLLPAWSMTPDERASCGLTSLEDLCAQVRRSADALERLDHLASLAPSGATGYGGGSIDRATARPRRVPSTR